MVANDDRLLQVSSVSILVPTVRFTVNNKEVALTSRSSSSTRNQYSLDVYEVR